MKEEDYINELEKCYYEQGLADEYTMYWDDLMIIFEIVDSHFINNTHQKKISNIPELSESSGAESVQEDSEEKT